MDDAKRSRLDDVRFGALVGDSCRNRRLCSVMNWTVVTPTGDAILVCISFA